MKVIYRERQTGRSTELIKMCAEHDYSIIVCPTLIRASYLFKMANDMGYKIPMPTTFRDFMNRHYEPRFINSFLFDDLDASLCELAMNVPIEAVVFEKKEETA